MLLLVKKKTFFPSFSFLCCLCYVSSTYSRSWLSINSFSSLSVNVHTFLEKIMQWFPLSFAFEFRVPVMQGQTDKSTLLFHQKPQGGGRNGFMPFPRFISVKWTQQMRREFEPCSPNPLSVPITLRQPNIQNIYYYTVCH